MLMSVPPTDDRMYGFCVVGCTQPVRRPSMRSDICQ